MSFDKSIFVINHFPTGFALARYSNMIIAAINDSGTLMNIRFNPNFQKFPPGLLYEGTNSILLNVTARRFVYMDAVAKLKEAIEEGGVIHYTDQSMPPLTRGGYNEVVTFHDLFALHENKGIDGIIYKRFVSHFLRFRNAIAISDTTRADLEEHKFEGAVAVIYHGVDPIFHPRNNKMELRKKYGLSIDKNIIISVSSDAPRKNLKLLREVSERLEDNFEILRVGPPVGSRYNFSNVSDDTLAELYSASDAFILTSTDEGFNFPVVEAMASGIPVVVSDIPIMREIVGDAGILADVNSSESFIEGLKDAIGNWERFSGYSLRRSEKFSMNLFSQNMKSYYDGLL